MSWITYLLLFDLIITGIAFGIYPNWFWATLLMIVSYVTFSQINYERRQTKCLKE